MRQELHGLVLAHCVVRSLRLQAASEAAAARHGGARKRKAICDEMLDDILAEGSGPQPDRRNRRVVQRIHDSFPVQRRQPALPPTPDMALYSPVLQ